MTVGIIGKTGNAEVDNTVPFLMLLSENVFLRNIDDRLCRILSSSYPYIRVAD